MQIIIIYVISYVVCNYIEKKNIKKEKNLCLNLYNKLVINNCDQEFLMKEFEKYCRFLIMNGDKNLVYAALLNKKISEKNYIKINQFIDGQQYENLDNINFYDNEI